MGEASSEQGTASRRLRPCPTCGVAELEVVRTSEQIEAELALREAFFAGRIEGPLDRPDMKDRTDILHATGAALRLCRACGVLVREPDWRSFAEERYAPAVMEKMLRSNIDAYRAKERLYRPLLPEQAAVVEVGSYVGGFLHVAAEWGWSALGVDVGEDTAHFTASHGYPTRQAALADCAFDDASFDGVFIWTCFEQIDPSPLLDESARVLRNGGILVIRTPNALFYTCAVSLLDALRGRSSPTDRHPIVRLLAWNNLLGFSHQYGYAPRSLDRLVTSRGFEMVAHHGDTLIAPSHARLTATARRDEDRMNSAVLALQRSVSAFDPDAVATPWFEAVYRK